MQQQKIKVKPLSVNTCWKGRRFKTDDYKSYEKEVLYLLAPLKDKLSDRIALSFTFGFSSRKSDIDNCVKPLLDILAFKYGFNDSRVYRLSVIKDIVPKGQEYLSFQFG